MSPSNVSSLAIKTLAKDEDIVHASSNAGQSFVLFEKEKEQPDKMYSILPAR